MFIFDLSLVNSFIIFKENVNRRGRRTLANFRLALATQLINGFCSRLENRKRTMKGASVEGTTTPENAPGHFIIRREGNARKRHCVQCKKDGRKTASNRAKETIYECAQCGIALCKDPLETTVNSRFCDNNASFILSEQNEPQAATVHQCCASGYMLQSNKRAS